MFELVDTKHYNLHSQYEKCIYKPQRITLGRAQNLSDSFKFLTMRSYLTSNVLCDYTLKHKIRICIRYFFLFLFYNYSPAADRLPQWDPPLLWICVSGFSPVNIAWKYGHPAAKTTRWAAISTSSAMMVTSHNTLWLQRGERFHTCTLINSYTNYYLD